MSHVSAVETCSVLIFVLSLSPPPSDPPSHIKSPSFFSRISARFPSLKWLVLMEVESRMNGQGLKKRLKNDEEEFVGRALVDEQ